MVKKTLVSKGTITTYPISDDAGDTFVGIALEMDAGKLLKLPAEPVVAGIAGTSEPRTCGL